jgi:hypothetical protein
MASTGQLVGDDAYVALDAREAVAPHDVDDVAMATRVAFESQFADQRLSSRA